MSSNLISDLTQINLIKGNIKNAIETKGQTVANFASYPASIENIVSGGNGVKQYDSLENMYADISNAHNRDLAAVFYSNQTGITETTEFQIATFPKTVILDTALTSSVEVSFVAVDQSITFDCWGQLNGYIFSMDCYTDDGGIRIEYRSQDGITYTRTRFMKNREDISGDEMDFGVLIKFGSRWGGSSFNPVIGKFVVVGTTVFDGLFQYNGTNFNLLPNTGLNANTETVWNSKFYGINGIEVSTLQVNNNLSLEQLKDRVNLYSNISNLGLNANITSLYAKFSYSNLASIPNLDTSYITNMDYAFEGCRNLVNVPNFNTSNVTSMIRTFMTCTNLTSIPNFDTSNVVDISQMLCGCSNLESIPNFDTSNVTRFYNAFAGCTNLVTVPNFNTSKVTSLEEAFMVCTNLISIPNFDTSNVTQMYIAFEGCTNLITVPQFNTSKVTSMEATFHSCNNLSNASIQNIVNMCLNSNITTYKNISNTYSRSPLYRTKFDNSYYQNRWAELDAAGWSY